MTLVNRLAAYYKQCLYEEAKVSAFSNLHKEDNLIVKLKGHEKVLHNFPEPFVAQEESAELTKLMLTAEMNKKKQVLYGYMFITGKLLDETILYTPLVYADCSLERVNGKITVSVNSDTLSINLPLVAQLIGDVSERDILIRELSSLELSLPLTEDTIKAIDNVIVDITSKYITGVVSQEISINRENAVILTTINKGLVNVIEDLELISQAPRPILNKSVLKEVSDDEDNEEVTEALDEIYCSNFNASERDVTALSRFLPAFQLNSSQEKAVKSSSTDLITAITGGPGTGKTNTIAGIATNYLLNGKTVLICSKQNSAVDVVYNKLSALSRYPFVIRTGGKEYRKNLSELLDKIALNKFCLKDSDIEEQFKIVQYMNNVYDKNSDYKELIDISKILESDVIEAEKIYNDSKFTKLFKKIALNKLKRVYNETLQEIEEYQHTNEEDFLKLKKETMSKIGLGNFAKVISDNTLRRDLMILSKALSKGETTLYDYVSLFSELVENVLPCWCSTVTDIGSSIPPIAGLFDVVIIDEASQCDIATCLPALYRAKKAVIVGDDKQLKYLSFLSSVVNTASMALNRLHKYEYICNYKENSMFDFASYFSRGNIMLQEQYRGCSAIMNFSNEKFYENKIKNCGKPTVEFPITVSYVEGKTMAGKTCNNIEAQTVINKIKDIITEDKTIGKLVPTTIGILSPFREQVKLLEKMVTSVFTLEEIQKHKILVGTAHSFQGEERDIMLLSWTVADNSPVQSFTFINNPNLFNVSITRANKQVINILSTKSLPKGLLREYIEYVLREQKIQQSNI